MLPPSESSPATENENENPKQSERKRASRLKQKYGITPDEYARRLRFQGGRCAICQSEPTEDKPLVVDHDHLTGKVRGLLCSHCNSVLGFAKESVVTLQCAMAYLIGAKNSAAARTPLAKKLMLRRGLWYVRKIVPERLRDIMGQTELRASLKTSVHSEAVALANAKLREFEAEIAKAQLILNTRQRDLRSLADPLEPHLCQALGQHPERYRPVGSTDHAVRPAPDGVPVLL